MKYTIRNSDRDILMEYNTPISAKYSTARAYLKAYSKQWIEAVVFEEGDAEPITREQCEYMLK